MEEWDADEGRENQEDKGWAVENPNIKRDREELGLRCMQRIHAPNEGT